MDNILDVGMRLCAEDGGSIQLSVQMRHIIEVQRFSCDLLERGKVRHGLSHDLARIANLVAEKMGEASACSLFPAPQFRRGATHERFSGSA
jgi:hypothetical protein